MLFFKGNEQPRRWWPRSFVVRHTLWKVRRCSVLENAHPVAAAPVKDRIQAPGTALQAIEKTVRANHSRGGSIFAGFDCVDADERAGVEPPATLLGSAKSAVELVERQDVSHGLSPFRCPASRPPFSHIVRRPPSDGGRAA